MRGTLFHRAQLLDVVMWGGLALAGIGLLWAILPAQDSDTNYFPRIRRQAYGRRGPRVMIDEAHWNMHTARGRYRPLAQLLDRDGYRLTRNKQPFVRESFRGTEILVIANALGFKGAVQNLANLAGLEGKVDLTAEAFEPEEIVVVRDWVRAGGSLLLIADHAPCGQAARSLAAAFGVEMTGWYVDDPGPTIRYDREKGLLDHPITRGRADFDERVDRVVTYGGQALIAPPESQIFLLLSYNSVEHPRREPSPHEARPAGGKVQGLALDFEKGRVVVMGEAAALTAQRVRRNGQDIRYGINDDQTGNKQLTLNILHWLSRIL
jgi:hypothetical protein